MGEVSIRRLSIVLGDRYDVSEFTIFPATQTVEVRNFFPSGETSDSGKVSLSEFLLHCQALARRTPKSEGSE